MVRRPKTHIHSLDQATTFPFALGGRNTMGWRLTELLINSGSCGKVGTHCWESGSVPVERAESAAAAHRPPSAESWNRAGGPGGPPPPRSQFLRRQSGGLGRGAGRDRLGRRSPAAHGRAEVLNSAEARAGSTAARPLPFHLPGVC